MPYDPRVVQPMREEMVRMGATELTGSARPGLALALQHATRPQQVLTVFAGQDTDAAARARQYFSDYAPSSPSLALFRDGEVVHFVHRHQIEGRGPQDIARDLVAAFDKHCATSEV